MMRRRVVLKVGGELLTDAARLDALAAEIASLRKAGFALIVLHGGGPQASALQKTLGLEPKIVAGRRVTDRATLEVAKMVFAGTLNTELVAALGRHGVRAVGVSGADAGLVRARRRPPVTMHHEGRALEVDFGFVGDVEAVDPALAFLLAGHGYVPVVCSLAAQSDGTILNVNADTMAAELAVGVDAAALVVLTNVPGVYRDAATKGVVFETLSVEQARALIADGTAAGGMAPKLTACIAAVERGVAAAWILDGTAPGTLHQALAHGAPIGTLVTALAGNRRAALAG